MVFGRVNFFMSVAWGVRNTSLDSAPVGEEMAESRETEELRRRMAILLCFAPRADCIMYMHEERAYSEVMVEQKLGFIGAAVSMRRRLRSAARNRFCLVLL
jgi:hypothetical protein